MRCQKCTPAVPLSQAVGRGGLQVAARALVAVLCSAYHAYKHPQGSLTGAVFPKGPGGAPKRQPQPWSFTGPHRSQATRLRTAAGAVPSAQHMPPRASARTVHHQRLTGQRRPRRPDNQRTERHEAPARTFRPRGGRRPPPRRGLGLPQKPHKRSKPQNHSGARGSRTVCM